MTPQEEKAALRSQLRTLRAEAHAREPDAGERLAERFNPRLFTRYGPVVAGYWPLGDEIDPRPLMARLAGLGAQLCLPRTAADGRMDFRAWSPGAPLEAVRFGLQEPAADAPSCEPGLVLVPLLGFDSSGHRLGHGKGYYDRYLAARRQAGCVFACGLAHEVQHVAGLPGEAHDQRLDWVVTPDRNHPVMLARMAGG